MSAAPLEPQVGLWTEADYFAMGERTNRIELLDGSLHAIARISWYLLVEQDGDSHSLRLHRLDGGHYVEDRIAKAGETLTVTEPFRWELDPATLR